MLDSYETYELERRVAAPPPLSGWSHVVLGKSSNFLREESVN